MWRVVYFLLTIRPSDHTPSVWICRILFYICLVIIENDDKKMKTSEILNYEAPQVEIIEVEVEKGFAVSTGDAPDYPYGGSLNQ